jgi:hypothetical protein
LHAQFGETFGSHLSRPLRLHVLSRIRRAPLASTNDLTAEECRNLARFLRDARNEPGRVDAMLRRAAAELAPDKGEVAKATESLDRCERSRAELSNVDTALELLARIGELGLDGRFACGDAALILCAMAPESPRREVLTEHLRGRGMDQLRAFLCPAFPPLDGLSPDEALRFEKSAVWTWLDVARVAERVPQEVRDTFPGLGFAWFHAAATTLEARDGKKCPPSTQEICRRLAAVADAESAFRRPADLRAWIRSGSDVLPDPTPIEKPDLVSEAYEFFKARFHELDNTREAFVQTFERYRLAGVRR